jgi:hypothetical protein
VAADEAGDVVTADQIFDEIAAHHHGRMQTAGVWVPWGDYIIEAVDDLSPAGWTKRCAAGWTVRCGNRIVAKGGAESPHEAWRRGCDAIAADLSFDEAAS